MKNFKLLVDKLLKQRNAREGKVLSNKQHVNQGHWSFEDSGLIQEENMLRANLFKQSC